MNMSARESSSDEKGNFWELCAGIWQQSCGGSAFACGEIDAECGMTNIIISVFTLSTVIMTYELITLVFFRKSQPIFQTSKR